MKQKNSKWFYGSPNPFFLPFPIVIQFFDQLFSIVEIVLPIHNVWLVNGSSDRDKERHAVDLYEGASAGIPWSPGDACKLVYSSFPCGLFGPNFRWSGRWSHQMDLV